ncbi:hypothetical protein, conserved in P.knowlesi [Plasmodium knowlesi strain H]|uniref:Pv-fam-d protein n=3 Tax=Plasmodium knowlesi TaxID=5850 RepID=A0A5K1UUS0_PLAKH|nr:uncharacterized protein PKNH_0100500 [Plasmodium knowlesi strain H]OTN68755.1 Uncharacterized protein PKNOH_S01008800 [Plasmodium knowlesi]CAA9986091.1 hypothetical protein, conserved in P.knowlesi [Plasmodium knowlesi strain H]SBO25241.1 hypothetical protein, conserved in P.knowlesi [Plasmodium knowlesi strain H]SBO27587.1 hypothetical protein, conserved in P.knowlesi [Plasmodium knowlesi strain H]VVS75565.1 hypothetical protein, conserved in P.knowlesi [Plasmodium knowlesi strain H]|eukprot:XP_002257501.1 [Plasmodium knowlesi strain H]
MISLRKLPLFIFVVYSWQCFGNYVSALSTLDDSTSMESLFTKVQKTKFPHHNGHHHHNDGYGGHNDSMSTLSSSVDTIFKKEGIRTNYKASYKAPHKTLYEALHEIPYRAPHEVSYRGPHKVPYKALHEFSYRAPHEVSYRGPHKTLFDAPHMARYGRMKIRPRGFFNKLLYNIEKIKRTGALLSPKVIRISLLYILALFCIGLIVVLPIGPQTPFAWMTCGMAISVLIACIYSSVRIAIK